MIEFIVESCILKVKAFQSPKYPIILATPKDIRAWQRRGIYPPQYIAADAISEKLQRGDHCFVMIERGWPLCWQLVATDTFELRIAGQEYRPPVSLSHDVAWCEWTYCAPEERRQGLALQLKLWALYQLKECGYRLALRMRRPDNLGSQLLGQAAGFAPYQKLFVEDDFLKVESLTGSEERIFSSPGTASTFWKYFLQHRNT
jgi:GNAT superfamily N-acetyltransferase